MAKLFCALLIATSLLWPSSASASEGKINLTLIRHDDGTTIGELWYNERVLWRLTLSADGAQPVAGNQGARTTVVVPDLDDGLFTLKIFNR